MIKGLAEFLRSRKNEITKTQRVNVVRKTVGYSEYTQWDTTVSFDEIEVVDFELLMQQIEEFEESFQEGGSNSHRNPQANWRPGWILE